MKNLYRWRISWIYRNVKNGIQNLWKWFPVIWNDRNFDQYYIWEILKFKLKEQSKYLGNHEWHLNSKRDSEIMMTCVRLIDKIQNEYYGDECFDYYENKIYFVASELKSKLISEHLDDYFKKYPRIYKQVMDMEDTYVTRETKVGIAINMGIVNGDRAKHILFKILETNINKWWD